MLTSLKSKESPDKSPTDSAMAGTQISERTLKYQVPGRHQKHTKPRRNFSLSDKTKGKKCRYKSELLTFIINSEHGESVFFFLPLLIPELQTRTKD